MDNQSHHLATIDFAVKRYGLPEFEAERALGV